MYSHISKPSAKARFCCDQIEALEFSGQSLWELTLLSYHFLGHLSPCPGLVLQDFMLLLQAGGRGYIILALISTP